MTPSNLVLFTHQPDLVDAVRQAAEPLGYELKAFQSPADLLASASGDPVQKNRPGEPTKGEDASAFAAIVDLVPKLIMVDMDNLAINWKKWMPILKSSPATRRSPIVAWSAELAPETKAVAKARGAEIAISQEIFLRDVSKIIAKKARKTDVDGIASACAEPLSPLAIKGLELFNAGSYFDAHEELEHAWNEDTGPGRDLYRGVLQVGVAYLQIERGNYNGAIKMLMRVKQWLDPLPGVCRGINVAKLRNDAEQVHDRVRALGRDKISEFDTTSFEQVEYTA